MVYLWGIDVADAIESSTELAQGEELCAKTLVRLIQTLLHPKDGNSRLWIATRGAQATDSFSPSIGGAMQSLAWGIGRAFGLEAPGQYRRTDRSGPGHDAGDRREEPAGGDDGSGPGRSVGLPEWRTPGGSFTALKPGGFECGHARRNTEEWILSDHWRAWWNRVTGGEMGSGEGSQPSCFARQNWNRKQRRSILCGTPKGDQGD